jgi:S1-C subfamily serine protease
VVTNAHVVAGEQDTQVEIGGNPPGLTAHAVAFDAHDDVAILRVDGLAARPLAMAPNPRPGSAAAILGYPQDGPFDAEAARLGDTQTVDTEDAYGRGPVRRLITALRGRVRPGNSGGPLVDASGRVLATVFAAITNPSGTIGLGPDSGGFAVPDSVVRAQLRAAERRGGEVSTGPCAA